MPPSKHEFRPHKATSARHAYSASSQIRRTGLSGTFGLVLELPMTPQPTGFISVVAGETWYYQTWFRDAVGGMTTSNFTDGLEVAFL